MWGKDTPQAAVVAPTEKMIIAAASSTSVQHRGRAYYREGRVRNLREQKPAGGMEEQTRLFTAQVRGTLNYEVSLQLKKEKVVKYRCDCPGFYAYNGACKHVVALMYAVQEQQQAEQKTLRLTQEGMRIFDLFAPPQEERQMPEQFLQLEPVLELEMRRSLVFAALELQIRERGGRSYVVQNLLEFLRQMEDGHRQEIVMGKALTIRAAQAKFTAGRSAALWQVLLEAYHAVRPFLLYGMGSKVFDRKQLRLEPDQLAKVLAALGTEESFLLRLNGHTIAARIMVQSPELHLTVCPRGQATELRLEEESIRFLSASGRYLLAAEKIWLLPEEHLPEWRALEQTFAYEPAILLPDNQTGRLLAEIIPRLEQVAHVKVDESYLERYELLPLTAELFIDYYLDGVAVRPGYQYGEVTFNPLTEGPPEQMGERLLVRDTASEKEIEGVLQSHGFYVEEGRWVQPDEEACYDFLQEGLPHLSRIADVFYSQAFEQKPLQAMTPVSVGVSVNQENLLEVSLKNAHYDFDELVAILRSYKLRRRYHRLKNGSFVSLAEQQLAALADFVEDTGLGRGKKELGLAQAMYLSNLAEDEGIRMERSRSFREVVQEICHPQETAGVQVPACLQGVLRDYQHTGFNWLSSLARYRLGGILADDMGLGKTLEVISLLLARQGESKEPSLVVAPTSLVYNWLEEVQRFAPQLRTLVAAGNKKAREAVLEQAFTEQADLLVTTYNMLRSDLPAYQQHHFHYCFLDEAQHIKNPTTKAAQAVKALRRSCGTCFALTGTPIENTLTELWSIFDFIMPGYLSGHDRFRQRYELPIVRAEDEHAAQDLRRHIRPFVLRRLKKDVLTELPEKLENQLVNEMTTEQQKIYDAHFVQAQKEFRQELKLRGFDASRIQILALLTRLRQIVCDPSLFLDGYKGGSGKLDQLEEIVEEAVAGGHRLLIFSQFTTMLARIRTRLAKLNLQCSYLDGSTPARERIRLVKEFNAGSSPVFLLSLKAGGTGLNLTGADMVIHYDPWWNPAVEDQATDRAYRIGQKNSVQVLKLVTKNTIEEKIFKLQQRKKALIDNIVQPGETFLSKLSEDEVRELFT